LPDSHHLGMRFWRWNGAEGICKRLRASILSLFFLFLYLGYKNESLWIWQKIDLEKPENVSLKY
jgi:hypothetical protein